MRWESSSSFVFGGSALAAANAINAALNTTTADLVRLSNVGTTINNYNVVDSGGATLSTSFFNPGNWNVIGASGNNGVRAVIALVPAPATLMLALAGLGLVCLRRR